MKTIARLLLAISLLLGTAAPVLRAAEDLAAIKARMSARISEIDALKLKGALGENNQGLIEVRDATIKEAAAVAVAENKDREVVYAALAKQQGVTTAEIAKARARQLAAGSAKGVWVQDEKGAWAKK